ncbi:SH2 domain-containing protein 2A isoform X3 [Lontra canadensis]|uniref:SH2 domain-containing protein 2A isoform X3 n=1 Tax=Lontra canadensis TaxID=76717 RepID=UPI0013F2E1E5|nr:SH2 domain-containing protein 2A isoform X3 [Lontra canadensis]
MEFPLAQLCPQGTSRAPPPTFSTFQPMELPRRGCREVALLQAPKAEEDQPNPRVTAVHAAVSGTPAGTASSSAPIPPPAPPQPPGAASSPEDAGKAEEGPEEGGQSLQAETRAWFQKTQAHWLLQHGAAPAWFHGFITRREAERLLEPKPEGCYLVRFSESAVTFVLTYRSRTRCRHFLLAQLQDGRHVVLGEDSAHARLQDLLRHYTACPLSPYGETLTEPLIRQTPEPAGLSLSTEGSDPGSKDPPPQYSPIVKKLQNVTPTQKEGTGEQKEEPDEAIAFYAMGRGSPGEAPGNVYAEVEAEAPPGAGGPPCVLGHPALRKCRSRPVPGGQVTGCREEANRRLQGSLHFGPCPSPSPSHPYPTLCLESWVQPSPLVGTWGLSRAGSLPSTFTAPPS